MSLKLAQDVWYESWEEAGSRGLDTWYALEDGTLDRDADDLLGVNGYETYSVTEAN